MTVQNDFDNFHTSTSISSTTNGAQNESKVFERSNETNSTDHLLSTSLNKKKRIPDYRRAPARKVDPSVDYGKTFEIDQIDYEAEYLIRSE